MSDRAEPGEPGEARWTLTAAGRGQAAGQRAAAGRARTAPHRGRVDLVALPEGTTCTHCGAPAWRGWPLFGDPAQAVPLCDRHWPRASTGNGNRSTTGAGAP